MAYDITAINPFLPLPKDPTHFMVSRFTLNNVRWRRAVEALGAICDSVTADDRDKLTNYDGRVLSGEKAEQVLIALRRVLLHRQRHSVFVVGSDEIKATPWLWEDLEKIYEMLCWSDGFTVW